MTTDQLIYLLTVEKHMNFTSAAEELCISQPSLSRQIQAIEHEVGVSLFSRNSRNITLTKAGKEFLDYARSSVNEYNKMMQSMKYYSIKNNRNITLTSLPVMSLYRIVDVITEFKSVQPDINIEIIEENAKNVMWSLNSYKADLGFIIYDTINVCDLKLFPLLNDELVMIVGKNHRFAGRETVSLAEAENEEFLFLGNGSAVYDFSIEQCMKFGYYPKIVNAMHNNVRIETISNLVSRNFGVSLVILKAALHYSYLGYKIIRLKEKPMLHSAMITRDEILTPACKTFIRFAEEYYAEWDRVYKQSRGDL